MVPLLVVFEVLNSVLKTSNYFEKKKVCSKICWQVHINIFTALLKKMSSLNLYLQSASFHHDLLSGWLNSCQGKELSLEHHRRLLGIQLYCIKLLFAPFHVY